VKVRTWLVCERCGRETLHDLRYAGTTLRGASCIACGLETPLVEHPVAGYVHDVHGRILSKPERMARELRYRPRRVLSLPRRVASKVARMGSEVIELIR
jgi:hypothetical protein